MNGEMGDFSRGGPAGLEQGSPGVPEGWYAAAPDDTRMLMFGPPVSHPFGYPAEMGPPAVMAGPAGAHPLVRPYAPVPMALPPQMLPPMLGQPPFSYHVPTTSALHTHIAGGGVGAYFAGSHADSETDSPAGAGWSGGKSSTGSSGDSPAADECSSDTGAAAEPAPLELEWTDTSQKHGCGVPIDTAGKVTAQVTVDKGFKWVRGHGVTCHKKNHFQLTVTLEADGPVRTVRRRGAANAEHVTGLVLEIYGVKHERPDEVVPILQASITRERSPLEPIAIELDKAHKAVLTPQRLHFATATGNNVRKKGRANPHQRYFQLVVKLSAQTTAGGTPVPLVVLESGRFVVRASSPRLLRATEPDATWNTAVSPGRVPRVWVHRNVGIQYTIPDEHLTVGGSCKITGELYQPSDIRVKTAVAPLDPHADLAALRRVELYGYTLRPEFAAAVGRAADPTETGVLAQQLATVWPGAVTRKPGVGCRFADGSVVDDLLLVKKERLGTALVAAVQAVAARGDALGARLAAAERETVRLARALRELRA